ncbi:MAG: hypothetical protein HY332_02670 [Chloroflexi bacterium]|nr:hypothetical protein [Chloroflexota bacterium]
MAPSADLAWRLLIEQMMAGGPNHRLGLVQAHHIFARVGSAHQFVRSGLLRVRIPANLIRLGDDGWRQDRFPDGWWMERLHHLGVPFKAVVELWPRFTNEQHAAHAARVVRRGKPNVVIIGNELNAVEQPGIDIAAEIERYLDRYEVMYAAIKRESAETRVQLYGEAYYGQPRSRTAFLRLVLAALRRRGLPPPDIAGLHYYDNVEGLPDRVAGYRELLADYGLRVALFVEELGIRQGVVDRWEEDRLARQPAWEPDEHPNRLAELRAHGWMTEAEQADAVAQHLATAAAVADGAQVFCAVDFDAEQQWRRGLVSGIYDRSRPALGAFRFVQRLLNDLEEVRFERAAEHEGVNRVMVTRRDGLSATMYWRAPVDPLTPQPPLPQGERGSSIVVPPYTFVCDARGELRLAPQAQPQRIELPAATTSEAGGAVRILF